MLGFALAALFGAVPARAEQSFTVGYSQFWGTNPFLVTRANGARKAAAEMTVVMISGEFDISVGSVCCRASAPTA